MGGDVVVAVGAVVFGVASPVAAHVTHTPPVHLCCRLDLSGARWPPPQPPAGDSYLWVHASDYFVCGNAHFPGSLPSDVAALGGQTMDHVVWRFSTLFAAPTALRLAVAPLLRELRLLFHRHGVGDVDGGATAAVAATASSSSSSSFADTYRRLLPGKATRSRSGGRSADDSSSASAAASARGEWQSRQSKVDTADSIGSWAAAGSGAPALTVLTGHDVTLFPLLVFLCRASKLELPSFWPGYSSCLVLELHGPFAAGEPEAVEKVGALAALLERPVGSASRE